MLVRRLRGLVRAPSSHDLPGSGGLASPQGAEYLRQNTIAPNRVRSPTKLIKSDQSAVRQWEIDGAKCDRECRPNWMSDNPRQNLPRSSRQLFQSDSAANAGVPMSPGRQMDTGSPRVPPSASKFKAPFRRRTRLSVTIIGGSGKVESKRDVQAWTPIGNRVFLYSRLSAASRVAIIWGKDADGCLLEQHA
jgi:hypothetical protein